MVAIVEAQKGSMEARGDKNLLTQDLRALAFPGVPSKSKSGSAQTATTPSSSSEVFTSAYDEEEQVDFSTLVDQKVLEDDDYEFDDDFSLNLNCVGESGMELSVVPLNLAQNGPETAEL